MSWGERWLVVDGLMTHPALSGTPPKRGFASGEVIRGARLLFSVSFQFLINSQPEVTPLWRGGRAADGVGSPCGGTYQHA